MSFHLFSDHSPTTSKFLNKLDYIGILVLMWGANVATVYFGFICDPGLRLFYWTAVGFSIRLVKGFLS